MSLVDLPTVLACPVCFRGGGGPLGAWYAATALLLVLPPAMVLVLVRLLSRRDAGATGGGRADGAAPTRGAP